MIDIADTIAISAMLIAALLLYLFPGFVSYFRRHEASMVIILVNIFLGWTLIVWLLCLVWAYSGPDNSQPVKKSKPIQNNLSDEITKLSELKQKGLITEDEFQQGKEKLLAK